jgi:hypothetical protein
MMVSVFCFPRQGRDVFTFPYHFTVGRMQNLGERAPIE